MLLGRQGRHLGTEGGGRPLAESYQEGPVCSRPTKSTAEESVQGWRETLEGGELRLEKQSRHKSCFITCLHF